MPFAILRQVSGGGGLQNFGDSSIPKELDEILVETARRRKHSGSRSGTSISQGAINDMPLHEVLTCIEADGWMLAQAQTCATGNKDMFGRSDMMTEYVFHREQENGLKRPRPSVALTDFSS